VSGGVHPLFLTTTSLLLRAERSPLGHADGTCEVPLADCSHHLRKNKHGRVGGGGVEGSIRKRGVRGHWRTRGKEERGSPGRGEWGPRRVGGGRNRWVVVGAEGGRGGHGNGHEQGRDEGNVGVGKNKVRGKEGRSEGKEGRRGGGEGVMGRVVTEWGGGGGWWSGDGG